MKLKKKHVVCDTTSKHSLGKTLNPMSWLVVFLLGIFFWVGLPIPSTLATEKSERVCQIKISILGWCLDNVARLWQSEAVCQVKIPIVGWCLDQHSIIILCLGIFVIISMIFAAVAGLLGNLQKIFDSFKSIRSQVTSTISDQNLLDIRKRLLKRLRMELELRLDNSLHQLIKLDLQMEDQYHQVGKPKVVLVSEDSPTPKQQLLRNLVLQFWDQESAPEDTLEQPGKMIDVFNRRGVQGKLLILGEPGSGKTTELVSLASDLLKQAETDDRAPIPILLELSNWKEDLPIEHWLVAQLKEGIYQLPPKISKRLLENQLLLPLLDGLDELGLERQGKCIKAIKQWMDKNRQQLYLVVCCRREEYEQGAAKLTTLNAAIYIKPLTEDQIQQYLKELNRFSLWQNFQHQPELLKLAQKPLFLTMLVVAYQGRAIINQRELLDAYIQKQLQPRASQKTYPEAKTFSPDQTLHYLSWLAQKLEADGKTEFLIERMQPNYLESSAQKIQYRVGLGLCAGLFAGLVSGLMFGLCAGLFTGLGFGLVIGTSSKLSLITPKEKIIDSWAIALVTWLSAWLFAVLNVVLGGLLGRLPDALFIGAFVGLMGVLLTDLIFIEMKIEEKTTPNQGIIRSMKNGLKFGLVTVIIFGLYHEVMSNPSSNLSDLSETGLIIANGLLIGLFGGLWVSLQHYSLRLILYCNGYVPCDYALFLAQAIEHRFIQRVGGRYRFMHDLLQKHFIHMSISEH